LRLVVRLVGAVPAAPAVLRVGVGRVVGVGAGPLGLACRVLRVRRGTDLATVDASLTGLPGHPGAEGGVQLGSVGRAGAVVERVVGAVGVVAVVARAVIDRVVDAVIGRVIGCVIGRVVDAVIGRVVVGECRRRVLLVLGQRRRRDRHLVVDL